MQSKYQMENMNCLYVFVVYYIRKSYQPNNPKANQITSKIHWHHFSLTTLAYNIAMKDKNDQSRKMTKVK